MASNFKSFNGTVSTTPSMVVYTAPALTSSIVINFTLNNKNSTLQRTVNILHYDSSATSEKNLIKSLIIPILDTYVYSDKIVLEAGDQLRMDVDVGTDVEFILNILEQT